MINTTPQKPIVWTIAGSDPSGGAGIQADLHTFNSLKVHGCSVITAITSQNNEGIHHIDYLSPKTIYAQIFSLEKIFSPRVIKLGMLGNPELFKHLIAFLNNFSGKVILDPLLFSSSGFPLFCGEIKNYISTLHTLFPYVDVLTPNITEVNLLLNRKIHSYADIQSAAAEFLSYGIKSVLIKGGHFMDEHFSQDYWTNGNTSFWISSKRVPDIQCRGTGCTLSAAITSCLALDYDIKDAIVISKMAINQAISSNDIIHHTTYLRHLSWPESQQDLPYISDTPLQSLPEKFAECNQTPLGIYPIVDSIEWLKELLPLGINTIQLRIKNKSMVEVEHQIQQGIELAQNYSVKLFINDYWQLALKYNAYGVHLGQEDLNTADIQQIRKAGLRLGISTHCYYEVARAHRFHPSYLACGPIYPTTSKVMPFPSQGIENLKRWRRTLHYPLVAIGGINLTNIHEVIATQVDGIALISAITQAADPKQTAVELIRSY